MTTASARTSLEYRVGAGTIEMQLAPTGAVAPAAARSVATAREDASLVGVGTREPTTTVVGGVDGDASTLLGTLGRWGGFRWQPDRWLHRAQLHTIFTLGAWKNYTMASRRVQVLLDEEDLSLIRGFGEARRGFA
jgi:hypothetical protein